MTSRAAPFELGDGPDACLLLHGLTGSPAEVRPLGEALAAAGVRAVGPLLPGHGTSPEDLALASRSDLLDAARAALLSLRGCRRLYLGGLSAGALLAVHLAARSWMREGLPELSALALLAPAIELRGLTWVFANVVGRLPALPLLLSKGERDVQKPAGVDQREGPTHPDGAYRSVPLRWGGELRLLSAEAQKLAPRVRARTLILLGAHDRTVAPGSAARLQRLLAGPVQVQTFAQSGHVLPLDVEGDAVARAVVDFCLSPAGLLQGGGH